MARDIRLAEHVKADVAFGPISSADSMDDIVRAKSRGLTAISVLASIDHLIETEASVTNYSPNARLDPPLRADADRDALRDAAMKGHLDALCSDHWP